MGRPDEDRLDNICRQDMQAIETSASRIRKASDDVLALLGPDTWSGKPAQDFETDFRGRLGQLFALFNAYPGEEARLIAKAKGRQDALDRQRTGP